MTKRVRRLSAVPTHNKATHNCMQRNRVASHDVARQVARCGSKPEKARLTIDVFARFRIASSLRNRLDCKLLASIRALCGSAFVHYIGTLPYYVTYSALRPFAPRPAIANSPYSVQPQEKKSSVHCCVGFPFRWLLCAAVCISICSLFTLYSFATRCNSTTTGYIASFTSQFAKTQTKHQVKRQFLIGNQYLESLRRWIAAGSMRPLFNKWEINNNWRTRFDSTTRRHKSETDYRSNGSFQVRGPRKR